VRFVKNVGLDAICAHGKMLGQLLTAELSSLPDVRVYHGRNQAGVVSFLLETEDAEQTAARLSSQGFSLRAGLHCAPLAHESAGTLDRGTVRVSFGHDASPAQTRALLEALGEWKMRKG